MNLKLNFSLLSLVLATLLAMPITSSAGIILSIGIAPPPLPVYDQPLCPGDGYIWTPGYWAYDDNDGYFWVPATWVEAPEPGFLWTPGYWDWVDSVYVFHEGYWGPRVGFYRGIDYGFGCKRLRKPSCSRQRFPLKMARCGARKIFLRSLKDLQRAG